MLTCISVMLRVDDYGSGHYWVSAFIFASFFSRVFTLSLRAAISALFFSIAATVFADAAVFLAGAFTAGFFTAVAFLAGAFLVAVFFAATFFAGAFLAGAFFAVVFAAAAIVAVVSLLPFSILLVKNYSVFS